MTLTIDRLNSTVDASAAETTRAQADAGFLANPWQSTPVYLVDEALMDILFPPRDRLTLDVERIRDILASHDPRRASPDDAPREQDRRDDTSLADMWKRLDECTVASSNPFVAWGVYCNNLGAGHLAAIKARADRDIDNRPSIFLCGERILGRAERASIGGAARAKAFGVLLRKVLYHELAHAFIDSVSASYGTSWGRVIEESLCNAIARTRFNKVADIALITQVMAEQPIEYAAHVYWQSMGREERRSARVWGEWTRKTSSWPDLWPWSESEWWYRHRVMRGRHDAIQSPVAVWQMLAWDILRMTVGYH